MRVNANALSLHPKQIHACIFFSCMPNQQNWLYFPMVVLILPTFLLQSFHYIYVSIPESLIGYFYFLDINCSNILNY